MVRKKKGSSTTSFKTFGFMINPHSLLIISQDGQKLAQVEVDSETAAKEVFMGEKLNQQLITTLGRSDFSTIWTDDPAGDPAVVEACRLMEQGEADAMLANATEEESAEPGTILGEITAKEASAQPEPNEQGEVAVHTKGTIFQTEVDGEFKNIPGQLLKIDDICRFFPERDPVDTALWRVAASPINSGAEGDDFIITMARVDDESAESEQVSIPQFKPSGKTKIIEVECELTKSEKNLHDIINELRVKKMEAASSATAYREEIKLIERRLFEYANGKAYTSMECLVENDWEGGTRRYIRPDTGKVVKEEDISKEEMQLNMNQALSDATPKPEQPATEDETIPEESETFDPDPTDFPPPDETGEEPEEEAVDVA